MGMTKNPTKAKLIENSATLPDYKVQKASPIKTTARDDIKLMISLYLAYLSSRIPNTKDPVTPKKMKVAPNILLSIGV